jgi:hypothetical protein
MTKTTDQLKQDYLDAAAAADAAYDAAVAGAATAYDAAVAAYVDDDAYADAAYELWQDRLKEEEK